MCSLENTIESNQNVTVKTRIEIAVDAAGGLSVEK
jgi:hypothetical protein